MNKLKVEATSSGKETTAEDGRTTVTITQIGESAARSAAKAKQLQTRSQKPTVLYSHDLVRPRAGSAPTSDTSKLQQAAVEFTTSLDLNKPSVSHPPPAPAGSIDPPSSDVDSETSDEDDDDQTTNDDMADDKSLQPQPFTGKPTDDADEFYRQFEKYVAYKELTAEKQFAMLKVLLAGQAGLWLEGLPTEKKNSLTTLKASFEATYIKPLYMKYRSAKDIFTRKQGDERVDDYIAHVQRLARNIGADDNMTMYAIINGLKPNIAAYVTQKDPKTTQEVIDAARVAELTNPSITLYHDDISDKMSQVQMEVRRLAQRLDRATTSAIAASSRSPSQERRVTFQPQPQYQSGRGGGARPARRYEGQKFQSTTGPGRPFRRWSPARPGPQQSQGQEREKCNKCGYNQHVHPQYCPAVNQRCNFCTKIGHFHRVCRAAAQSRQNQQQ